MISDEISLSGNGIVAMVRNELFGYKTPKNLLDGGLPFTDVDAKELQQRSEQYLPRYVLKQKLLVSGLHRPPTSRKRRG